MIPESLRIQPAVYQAIALAAQYHDGQTRKEPIFLEGIERGAQSFLPYIVHPLEVMKMVWRWRAGNTITLSAAICHDLLEDTSCPPEKIAALHPEILQVVEELTCPVDHRLDPHDKAKLKANYINSFGDKSVYALVIKAADRICNVWDFCGTNPGYAGKYLDKALPVFRVIHQRQQEISDRFGEITFLSIQGAHRELVEELGAQRV